MPSDDRFAQAEKLLEEGNPEFWDFDEDGLRVVGEVVDAFRGNTKHRANVPVLVLKLKDGSVRSVWGTGVLGDKLEDLERQGKLYPGDVVGVERGASQDTSKGGNDYWPYRVSRVAGPNAPASTSLFGAPPVAALPEGDALGGQTYADLRNRRDEPQEAEVVQESWGAPAPSRVASSQYDRDTGGF